MADGRPYVSVVIKYHFHGLITEVLESQCISLLAEYAPCKGEVVVHSLLYHSCGCMAISFVVLFGGLKYCL